MQLIVPDRKRGGTISEPVRLPGPEHEMCQSRKVSDLSDQVPERLIGTEDQFQRTW